MESNLELDFNSLLWLPPSCGKNWMVLDKIEDKVELGFGHPKGVIEVFLVPSRENVIAVMGIKNAETPQWNEVSGCLKVVSQVADCYGNTGHSESSRSEGQGISHHKLEKGIKLSQGLLTECHARAFGVAIVLPFVLGHDHG